MHKNIVFTMFLQRLLQILLCNKDQSWTAHWTTLDWTNGPVTVQSGLRSFAVSWTGPLNSRCEGGGVIVDGGHCKGLGIRVEFEMTKKKEHEKDLKMKAQMAIFAKWGGVLHFAKIIIFWVILDSF